MQNVAFSAQGLIVPPTRLLTAPSFARRAGVDRVLLKMESERALGSFKILGGMFAALHVLSDMVRKTISDVVGKPVPRAPLPRLLCASDGNHGLAVAAAARLAGTAATVFLHGLVERARADRIERMGGHIQWVAGTYDDAVGAAVEAARGAMVSSCRTPATSPTIRSCAWSCKAMVCWPVNWSANWPAAARWQVMLSSKRVSAGWPRPSRRDFRLICKGPTR